MYSSKRPIRESKYPDTKGKEHLIQEYGSLIVIDTSATPGGQVDTEITSVSIDGVNWEGFDKDSEVDPTDQAEAWIEQRTKESLP